MLLAPLREECLCPFNLKPGTCNLYLEEEGNLWKLFEGSWRKPSWEGNKVITQSEHDPLSTPSLRFRGASLHDFSNRGKRVWRTYLLTLTSRKILPAFPPVWNPQLVHPAPECIWVKPEDLGSSSRPVDLAAGHLQSLPDVLGIDLVQRK